MANFAFKIDTADEDAVLAGIAAAPQYDVRVANAIRRTIEMIHGLDDLHARAGLEDIEVYLGRSSESAGHVLSRWRAHRENRGHKYAAVLFTCDAYRAEDLEGVAVKVLTRLKDYNTLCVGNANVARGGGGGAPATDRALIYMTWTHRRRADRVRQTERRCDPRRGRRNQFGGRWRRDEAAA